MDVLRGLALWLISEPKNFPWYLPGLFGPLRKQQNFNNSESTLTTDS